MKVALSQTIFCGGAHIHGGANGRLHGRHGLPNGWPQSGTKTSPRRRFAKRARFTRWRSNRATIFHSRHRRASRTRSVVLRALRSPTCILAGGNRWNPPIATRCAPNIRRHARRFATSVTNFAAANPEKRTCLANLPSTPGRAGYGVVRLNTKTARSHWNAGRETFRHHFAPMTSSIRGAHARFPNR